MSRPARAGRPAVPSPAAVPGAAAAPARRLKQSSALLAGPPVCVGMNIDIASIDMVSEVNMVSSGRAQPAPGLFPSLPSPQVAAVSAGGGGAARRSERCPLPFKTLFPRRRAFLLPLFSPYHCRRPSPRVCRAALGTPAFSSPCPPGRPQLPGAPPAPAGASQPAGSGPGWPGRGWRAAPGGISLLLAPFRAKKPNSPACLVGKL